MARKSKKNPLHYNLDRLYEDSFDSRSLKRYKKRFPRKRSIEKLFPMGNIYLIGIDFYRTPDIPEKGRVTLQPILDDDWFERDGQWLRSWWKPKKQRFPQFADLDEHNFDFQMAMFAKFLTWRTQAGLGFSMSESTYRSIKRTCGRMSDMAQSLIFSSFDQVFEVAREHDQPTDIVIGLAPTKGLTEQLTPRMMLHELGEYITGLDLDEREERSKTLFVSNRHPQIPLLYPRFQNPRYYGNMLQSYIRRAELQIFFLEVYWSRGELFTRDDFIHPEDAPIDWDKYRKEWEDALAGIPPDVRGLERYEMKEWLQYDLGIPEVVLEGFAYPTEEEIEKAIDDVNDFCIEMTRRLFSIKEPIFMRL